MEIAIDQIVENRYRLLNIIGEGGIGNLYLAEDLLLSRKVVVKSINKKYWENEGVRKRINRESNLHAKLGVHPNIVALHNIVFHDERPLLILEFVEGYTLAELITLYANEGKFFSLAEATVIICQILTALEYIHKNDIVHRDIKPANIILHPSDATTWNVKLMDFGIAHEDGNDEFYTRLTTLSTSGPETPIYMAPERLDIERGGTKSAATDLYSVGVVFFELLDGAPPFQGNTTEVIHGHLQEKPRFKNQGLDLPEGIKAILFKALAKDISRRYSQAEEFKADLEQISQNSNTRDQENVFRERDESKTTLLYIPPSPTEDIYNKEKAINKKNYLREYLINLKMLALAAISLGVITIGVFALINENRIKNGTREIGHDNTAVSPVSSRKFLEKDARANQQADITNTDEQAANSDNQSSSVGVRKKSKLTADIAQQRETSDNQVSLAGVREKSNSTSKTSSNTDSAIEKFFKARRKNSSKKLAVSVDKEEKNKGPLSSSSFKRKTPSAQHTRKKDDVLIRDSNNCADLRKSYQLGDKSRLKQYIQQCTQ